MINKKTYEYLKKNNMIDGRRSRDCIGKILCTKKIKLFNMNSRMTAYLKSDYDRRHRPEMLEFYPFRVYFYSWILDFLTVSGRKGKDYYYAPHNTNKLLWLEIYHNSNRVRKKDALRFSYINFGAKRIYTDTGYSIEKKDINKYFKIIDD